MSNFIIETLGITASDVLAKKILIRYSFWKLAYIRMKLNQNNKEVNTFFKHHGGVFQSYFSENEKIKNTLWSRYSWDLSQ